MKKPGDRCFDPGSIYSKYPLPNRKSIFKFVNSYHNLCTYLNFLCQKEKNRNESTFRQLYLSLIDAVDPDRKKSRYFKYSSISKGSEVLKTMVDCCRENSADILHFSAVEKIKKYVQFYCDVETYSILEYNERTQALETWAGYHIKPYPDLSAAEFCIAAASPLIVYSLYSVSTQTAYSEQMAEAVESAYFPAICCLHTLLDNYVTIRSDQYEKKFNFTCFYKDLKTLQLRISELIKLANKKCCALQNNTFHLLVVKELINFYLKDDRAEFGLWKIATSRILADLPRELRKKVSI